MNVYLAALQLDITKKSTYVTKDIKKAFKKQAMKWHPDRNVGNEEKANKKMKEINEAYTSLLEILEMQSSLDDGPTAAKPTTASSAKPAKASAPAKPTTAVAPNKKPNATSSTKQPTAQKAKPMTAKKKEEYIAKKVEENKERIRLQNEELVRESILKKKQEKIQRQKEQQEKEAFYKSRQTQLDDFKQVEKDASFNQDAKHWIRKMEATFNNRHEIDLMLTVKLIYVDIFRGDMDNSSFSAGHLVTPTALEKISQIWYNYPGSVGTTKFVHNFASGYIHQCIAFAPSSAFFSKEVVMHHMQERAQDFLKMGQNISGTNKQELSLILAILPYA